MVKTSSRKQRGLGKARQHLIRSKLTDADATYNHVSSFFSIWLEEVSSLAENQWHFLLHTCSMLSLIPVASDPVTGRAKLPPKWKLCLHYSIASMYGLIMSYRFYITIQRAIEGKLDLLTYMCASSFTVLLVSASATLRTTWSPQVLSDLFNSWKSMQQEMEIRMGRSMTSFDDQGTSMKVVFLAIVIYICAINGSMLSLVGEVPTSVLTTLKRIGGLELPDYLPSIIWSLAFLPLEFLTVGPPTFAAGVCSMALALGIGTFKVFAQQARKVQVRNMKEWTKVYRLRRTMQVYNRILMDWGSDMAMVLLACVSCGVILLLYVTIRPSDLPFFVYICFPVVASLLMVIITWLTYDCVNIKRAVEDIGGNLELSLDLWRLEDMAARKTTVYDRMIKSLRPASLRLGSFTEATLEVPFNVWDEVLNQLLFLLEL